MTRYRSIFDPEAVVGQAADGRPLIAWFEQPHSYLVIPAGLRSAGQKMLALGRQVAALGDAASANRWTARAEALLAAADVIERGLERADAARPAGFLARCWGRLWGAA